MIRSARLLLAAVHHHVDELRHQPAPVLGIRQRPRGAGRCPSRHRDSWLRAPPLGALAPYLERLCLRPATPAVSSEPADDVVADARQVLHAAAADHTIECSCRLWPTPGMYDGHLDARWSAARGPPSGAPSSASSASWCTRGCTRPRFCGQRLHGGRLGLLPHRLPALPDQLVDSRHRISFRYGSLTGFPRTASQSTDRHQGQNSSFIATIARSVSTIGLVPEPIRSIGMPAAERSAPGAPRSRPSSWASSLRRSSPGAQELDPWCRC